MTVTCVNRALSSRASLMARNGVRPLMSVGATTPWVALLLSRTWTPCARAKIRAVGTNTRSGRTTSPRAFFIQAPSDSMTVRRCASRSARGEVHNRVVEQHC